MANGTDERLQAEKEMSGNIGALEGEPAQFMENSQGQVAATPTIETRAATRLVAGRIGMQQSDVKEDDTGIAIVAPAPKLEPPAPPVTLGSRPAASLVLPSYPVGRGVSLPFGQLLPRCARCSYRALITLTRHSTSGTNRVLCLDHGLSWTSYTEDLVLLKRYSFISPEHEVAIRAFLA